MNHPTDRLVHTAAFVTPVVEYRLEREITDGDGDYVIFVVNKDKCLALLQCFIFYF